MSYQNKRGGRIVLADIAKPDKDDWGSPLDALQFAFEVKKSLNQSLLALEELAGQHNDPQLDDFVEGQSRDYMHRILAISQAPHFIVHLQLIQVIKHC